MATTLPGVTLPHPSMLDTRLDIRLPDTRLDAGMNTGPFPTTIQEKHLSTSLLQDTCLEKRWAQGDIVDFEPSVHKKKPAPLQAVAPMHMDETTDKESAKRSIGPSPFKLSCVPEDRLPEDMMPEAMMVEPKPPAFKPEAFDHLFGPNPSKLHFSQGSMGDCYLLAALDTLLRHPAGETVLRRISVETIRDSQNRVQRYRVTFPASQYDEQAVEFPASEFAPDRYGAKLLQGPEVLRILELAYAKLIRKARNQIRSVPYPLDGVGHTPLIVAGGQTCDVLLDLCGGERIHLTPRHDDPEESTILPSDTLSKSPKTNQLAIDTLFRFAISPNSHYLLCAYTPRAEKPDQVRTIAFNRNGKTVLKSFPASHAYSIRAFNPLTGMVTVANPHDTASQVETLTLKEFLQVFRGISGVRLPR